MFSPRKKLSRRAVLRGAGVAIGLPSLEAMLPVGRAASDPGKICGLNRVGYVYLPGGFHGSAGMPSVARYDAFPARLKTTAAAGQHITVVADAKLDLSGRFAGLPRPAAFMQLATAERATADQVASRLLGAGAKLPSLQMATGTPNVASHCARDQGPLDHMSWQSATTPLPGDTSPRRVFEKLFGDAGQPLRFSAKRSVLDVAEDRRRLVAALGVADRRRLEAYFESIRRIEQQVDVVERDLQRQPTLGTVVPVASIDDEPSFAAQTRVLFDLLLLAYQTDATRVATFQLGCPGPHATGDRLARSNQVAAALFTEFVGNLADTPAGDGTLLDQTLLMFGSSASEPTDRPSADAPLILAGGPLRDGPRHVTASGTTVADVHRWVLSYAEGVGNPGPGSRSAPWERGRPV